jgi:hypothetical protein
MIGGTNLEKTVQPAADVSDAPNTSEKDIPPPHARDEAVGANDQAEYMKGWRLYMLTAGIWIALFLSTLETTIVSTSLVSIADSLSGFEDRNWVVTAYFLTYTGMISRGSNLMCVKRALTCVYRTIQASLSFMPSWPAFSGPRPCFFSLSPSLPSSRSAAVRPAL